MLIMSLEGKSFAFGASPSPCNMGQRQKASRTVAGKDCLIELPNEILAKVITRLSLKEAVRTSILSRSWRSVWTYHSDILCDSVGILGNRIYSNSISCHLGVSDRQLQRHYFVDTVDHLMHQLQRGVKMDSLAIHFHLGKEFSYHITKWMLFAFIKGVESMDVDLSEWRCFKIDSVPVAEFERYTFPCSLLASPLRRCTLKHLRLAYCNLGSVPCCRRLSSLITVVLHDVNISDQQMEHFLLSCSCLEKMSLHACNDLVKLKFSYSKCQLKFLSIRNCFRLDSIELSADNLTIFEYTGELVTFSFKNVPRLADMYLSFTGKSRQDGVSSVLTKFAFDVPHLETLSLLSVLALHTLKLPDKVLKFTNVKELSLTVFPFQDEDKFDWVIYVLKAFPFLRNLELNLFSPSYIGKFQPIQRQLPECHHGFITKLEVNGFYGNPHETELLKFLLDNLSELGVLYLNPCHKIHKGFRCWDFEGPTKWNKLRPATVDWLHDFVPPNVQLHIL